MRHHTLGPSFQSFGPHFRISLVLVTIGGLFSWLAFIAAAEFRSWIGWAIFYFVAIGFGLLVVRQLFFRLWLHESGISYRGLLGAHEIHWREIDRIYFGSYEIHVHYIALGTFYRLRLVTKQGMKLSLGERLHSADVLADQIQGYTLPEMLRKALSEFESGVELDFGKIRIGRKRGVMYERWFAWHEIRWEDLTIYGVSDSHVNLGGAKRMFQVNIAAEKIANVHVLEALLDRVRKGTLRVGA
jgi:hypothetical protein